jgi:hypothetical protein
VPLGVSNDGRSAACNYEAPTSAGTGRTQPGNPSEDSSNEYIVDENLNSSTDSGSAREDATSASSVALDSASPIHSSGRTSTAASGSSSRHWRRYRDIGTTASIRSPLHRALLGAWSTNQRGASSHPEVYIDDRGPLRYNSRDLEAVTNPASASMLARTVESIMATFEDEEDPQRGTGIWSLGGLSRRNPRGEESVDISGLTWDPDGK